MADTSDNKSILHIGIDIGGTFTDFVIYSQANGKLSTSKRLSTPENPARAVIEGLKVLLEEQDDVDPTEIVITHGSTVATNALLERKGSKTALVTTKGFRDVIQIGRQDRPELYNLSVQPRPQLVPKELRFEISERVNHLGETLIPLHPEELTELLSKIDDKKPEAVAVCLLFAFLSPQHERTIAKSLRKHGYFVSISSEILPEYREFERTSTTFINAYVTPVLDHYLGYFESKLPDYSTSYHLRIMQSNGGIIGLDEARRSGVHCILSGPAGGVVAAGFLGHIARISPDIKTDQNSTENLSLITFDMGGTSTDVALIDRVPVVTTESHVGGYPISIPVLDIHTIGAGGGSIARIDEGGVLRVGPESAGANPGPACYGKGSLPTVTDANLVLGRLQSDHFLGGEMSLDSERAKEVMEKLGKQVHLDPVEAALGVIDVINAHMVRAIRLVSTERGYDPEDFTLLSYGGAGGLHACELARQLGIPRVIVPPIASTFSAFGMLAADVIKDYSQTIMLPGNTMESQILDVFEDVERKGYQDMLNEGFSPENICLERTLDLRYLGQSYELNIPYREDYLADFHRAHQKLYGYSRNEAMVELVNVRLRVIGKIESPKLESMPYTGKDPTQAYIKKRNVYLADGSQEIPLYQGELLSNGNSIDGPAIIVKKDTTVFLAIDSSLNVDHLGNFIIFTKK